MSEASYMLSPWKLQAVSTGWRALILNSSDPEHTILHGPQAQTSNSYYTQSLNVCTIQHLALPCFVLHFIDLFCMYVCIWVHAWQHMYGNQRTWVSSLLLWILVLELRMSNLAASTFTHWTMLLAHILCFGFNLSHEDKYGLFFLSVLKVSDFGALRIPFFFWTGILMWTWFSRFVNHPIPLPLRNRSSFSLYYIPGLRFRLSELIPYL